MWTYRAFRFPWTTTMFTLSADTLDFGKLPTRVTSDRSVTVRNRTSQTLTITCVQSTDPSFAVLTPVPFSIGPGGSWPVTVRVGTVTPQLLFGTLYIRTASDTSLVAQSAYMRARVVASLPAANRGLAGLLAAGLLGSGLWALRRRQAALAAALKRWSSGPDSPVPLPPGRRRGAPART